MYTEKLWVKDIKNGKVKRTQNTENVLCLDCNTMEKVNKTEAIGWKLSHFKFDFTSILTSNHIHYD